MRLAILLICLLADCSKSDENLYFESFETVFKVLVNQTVFIPCTLNDMDNATIRWYKNGKMLENSTRLQIIAENNTLKISNLTANDSGDFLCSISKSGRNYTQAHRIEVLEPPQIIPNPVEGKLEMEAFADVVLECKTTGVPTPLVKWFFHDEQLKNNETFKQNEDPHGQILRFKIRKYQDTGNYRCEADNGVGQMASKHFNLSVYHKPEITVRKSWLHSGLGERAELTCEIVANPRTKVDWFREEVLVNFTSRISTKVWGNRYSLVIKNLIFSDFARYACQGTNFLGRAVEKLELSGLSNPPIFKKEPKKRTKQSYTLVWEADSYSPIIRYNLQFRKISLSNKSESWIKLIIPSDAATGPIHTETFKLTGLEPATIYEAQLSAHNQFGWSQMSDYFKFATEGADIIDDLNSENFPVVEIQEKSADPNDNLRYKTGSAFEIKPHAFVVVTFASAVSGMKFL